MNKIKVALVQMPVVSDKMKNVKTAVQYVEKAKKQEVDLVVLPEMFCCPYETISFPLYAEKEGGTVFSMLSELAKENSIYLVGGSMPEIDENGKIYNTSYVFNREGLLIGKHRKAHLFDIQVEGGQCFKESDTLSPGNEITVFSTEFGKIGLAICYDFRFPELSRSMINKGAEMIIVPAAFNMTTGPAHWEILFRSRAIDNQVYTLGAAPARNPDASYVSYGNSIIVSPWGTVVAQLNEVEDLLISTLDLDLVQKIRRELPLLSHRRFHIY